LGRRAIESFHFASNEGSAGLPIANLSFSPSISLWDPRVVGSLDKSLAARRSGESVVMLAAYLVPGATHAATEMQFTMLARVADQVGIKR
jgi:hypothetical protein